MNEIKLKFKLTRPAKKLGGDLYEYKKKGDAEFMALYFPQTISRKDGVIRESLTLTISD